VDVRQRAFEGSWIPNMAADDYYGFHKTVWALLTFVAAGGSFEDYELIA